MIGARLRKVGLGTWDVHPNRQRLPVHKILGCWVVIVIGFTGPPAFVVCKSVFAPLDGVILVNSGVIGEYENNGWGLAGYSMLWAIQR